VFSFFFRSAIGLAYNWKELACWPALPAPAEVASAADLVSTQIDAASDKACDSISFTRRKISNSSAIPLLTFPTPSTPSVSCLKVNAKVLLTGKKLIGSAAAVRRLAPYWLSSMAVCSSFHSNFYASITLRSTQSGAPTWRA